MRYVALILSLLLFGAGSASAGSEMCRLPSTMPSHACYDQTPGVVVSLECTYEPGKREVCCWAELTEEEWRNCPTHSYYFTSKDEKKKSWRVNARSGWVCAPPGHPNLGYKTSTGRHLIARFHKPGRVSYTPVK